MSSDEQPATPVTDEEAPPAPREPGPYALAVEEYLAAADWLTVLEGPLKVHARSIANSLDRQLADRGEIQSALASSFDKVLVRLEARRPAPAGALPGLGDSGPMGEQSIFTIGLEA